MAVGAQADEVSILAHGEVEECVACPPGCPQRVGGAARAMPGEMLRHRLGGPASAVVADGGDQNVVRDAQTGQCSQHGPPRLGTILPSDDDAAALEMPGSRRHDHDGATRFHHGRSRPHAGRARIRVVRSAADDDDEVGGACTRDEMRDRVGKGRVPGRAEPRPRAAFEHVARLIEKLAYPVRVLLEVGDGGLDIVHQDRDRKRVGGNTGQGRREPARQVGGEADPVRRGTTEVGGDADVTLTHGPSLPPFR